MSGYKYIFKVFSNLQSEMSNTPCAYHGGQIITYFCRCLPCLLPLCSLCIGVHQKQHQQLSTPIELIKIHEAIDQVGFGISKQFQNLDIFVAETVTHFRKNDESHRRVLQEISKNKEQMLDCVNSIYDNVFLEIETNNRRRQSWMQEFMNSITQIKEQFSSLMHSLRKQKYLRTVIMWNRLNPEQTMLKIIEKAKNQWLTPSFTGWQLDQFASNLINNMNLNLLEIEGDTGSYKMLKLLRVLRYGEQNADFLSSSQVSIKNMAPPYTPQHVKQLSSLPMSPSMRKSSHKKIVVLSSLDKN